MLNEKLQQLHDEIKPAFNESILESLPINESHDYKQFKIFPIELLVKAEWNYKVEDENSSKKLRENLKRVGQTETIHVRLLHTGYFEVVNGNHRYDEMIALGRKTVIAYDHGQITKEEAFRRCLETNEKWFDTDNVQLGRMMKQLSESASIDDLITTMPFSEEEINNFKKLAEMDTARNVRSDSYKVPKNLDLIKTCIKVGDVFEIGEHKLLCGDSTDFNSVKEFVGDKKADMIFTDPPYGIDYSGGRTQLMNQKDYGKIKNDDLRGGELGNLIQNIFLFNKQEADVYVCVSPIMQKPFLDFIEKQEKEINAVIVWDKKQPGLGYMAYRRQCEFILFVKGGKFKKGDKSDLDLWSINRDSGIDYQHGNQKPIAVPTRAILNSSKMGDLVIDYFLGSGSTMVSCEENGRVCYGIEIDPRHCDIIVKRMITFNQNLLIKRNGQDETEFWKEMVVKDNINS